MINKNVLKYLKILISIFMIIIIVGNSYASLSASDGSAFVTKGEFDSAIADFNSRLTTFESGVNSKIDSQVTSYLDRNGIWSGTKQKLKNTETPRVGFATNSTKITGIDYCIKSDGYLYGLKINNCYCLEAYGNGSERVIIEKCSKSGLLLAFYNSIGDATVAYAQVVYGNLTKTTINQDWQKGIAVYNFNFMKGKDSTSLEIANVITRQVTLTMPGQIRVPTYGLGSVNFFVKKDDMITVQTTAILDQGNVRPVSTNAGEFIEKLVFIDISIY